MASGEAGRAGAGLAGRARGRRGRQGSGRVTLAGVRPYGAALAGVRRGRRRGTVVRRSVFGSRAGSCLGSAARRRRRLRREPAHGRSAARRLPSVAPVAARGRRRLLARREPAAPAAAPEVPLSADVVVGASMVCLASNIFRSVCALPRSEGACFPPRTACFSPFVPRGQCGHIQPVFRSVRTSRRECDIGRSTSPQHPTAHERLGRITENAGLRSLRPVRLHCPAFDPRRETLHPLRTRTGVDHTGSAATTSLPIRYREFHGGESAVPTITGRGVSIHRHPTDAARARVSVRPQSRQRVPKDSQPGRAGPPAGHRCFT